MSYVNNRLFGKRILVVEPSYLIARHLCDVLRKRGVFQLGPAATEAQAHDIVSDNAVQAVIFNAELREGTLAAVLAFRLAAWNIPSLLLTHLHLPQTHPLRRGRPQLIYPFLDHQLEQAVEALFAPPATASFWTTASADLP